jgi:hypothetical protein
MRCHWILQFPGKVSPRDAQASADMTFTPGFEAVPQINGAAVRVCRTCGGAVRLRNGECIRCLLRAGLFYSEEIDSRDFRSIINDVDSTDSA